MSHDDQARRMIGAARRSSSLPVYLSKGLVPRRLSSQAAGGETSGREKGNYVIAGSLLAFVGGIYYTAINKMKQQDDLADALEEDAGLVKK